MLLYIDIQLQLRIEEVDYANQSITLNGSVCLHDRIPSPFTGYTTGRDLARSLCSKGHINALMHPISRLDGLSEPQE